MKPKKKETVSVQEIMNNPVDAGQKALRMQREGVLGWLSYVGYMCVVMPIVSAGYFKMNSSYPRQVFAPFYENDYILLGFCCVGLLLYMLIIWKSRYPFSKRDRGLISVQFTMFMIGIFLTRFLLEGYRWQSSVETLVEYGIPVLWLYLIGWYLRYFYYKAKDGYRYVWLKVALSTVLPFVPLLLGIREIIGSTIYDPEPLMMGDVVMD